MFIRGYLRASTDEQNPQRAKNTLEDFAAEHGCVIAKIYAESASGTTRNRTALMELMTDAKPGDVLLVESIDRLTRLNARLWAELRAHIETQGLRIVAVDLPTSHAGMSPPGEDPFTNRILQAINTLMVEIMAAVARKDYETRRIRQAQGIAKARYAGKYRGKQRDSKKWSRVLDALSKGCSVRETAHIVGVSTSTVSRVKKAHDAGEKIF